jgi:small subunit ribosomal protein S4
MARYIGPTEKISRRAGKNLFLKGERSKGPKNALTRRPYAPGAHGPSRRQGKLSDFGRQLREKQNTKAIYGILEKQFSNYYKKAANATGATGENLLRMLELRLDSVVYRLGLADTRRQSRQYVSHGHVLVNGKRISIPSYQVKKGDAIELVNIDRQANKEELPLWLEQNKNKLSGKVLSIPKREEIPMEINEQLIVEYYSR